MCVLDLLVLIKKQPSPETNPAIQYLTSKLLESKLAFVTSGLNSGVTLGKATCNLSGKPLLIEALMLISLCNPISVRCCLLLTTLKAFLNNPHAFEF